MSQRSVFLVPALCGIALGAGLLYAALPTGVKVETGQAAFTDYRRQQPGTVRKITVADLPQPYATQAVDNGAHLVARPADAWPKALPGFSVTEYATGLTNPRLVRTAPNGDLFVVESEPGQIRVMRGVDAHGHAEKMEVYATGLAQPFGLAFYPLGPNPAYLYVANTNSVVRFPYHNGDLQAAGKPETVVAKIPGGGRLRGGGHWTPTWPFRATAPGCSSRLARIPTSTIRTTTPQNFTAPTFWWRSPMDPDSKSTPGEFATRWGLRFTPDRPIVGVGE